MGFNPLAASYGVGVCPLRGVQLGSTWQFPAFRVLRSLLALCVAFCDGAMMDRPYHLPELVG